MNLTFDDSAIVAWLPFCSPIVCFLAVANALTLDTSNQNRGLQLGCLNFLIHSVRSGLTSRTQLRWTCDVNREGGTGMASRGWHRFI